MLIYVYIVVAVVLLCFALLSEKPGANHSFADKINLWLKKPIKDNCMYQLQKRKIKKKDK